MTSERWYEKFSFAIFITAVVVSLLGIVNLSSAARATMPMLYTKQLLWLFLGLALALFIQRMRTATFEMLTYPLYTMTTFLLVLVLLIGPSIKGAKRWIDVGPFNMQPSELAKISMIFFVAHYFSRYQVDGGYTLQGLLRPFNLTRPLGLILGIFYFFYRQKNEDFEYGTWIGLAALGCALIWLGLAIFYSLREGFNWQAVVAPMDWILLPVILILLEPDLGTATLTFMIAASMLLFAGIRWKDILLALVIALGGAILAWNFTLHDYQRKRIETFLNPEADQQGSGYHAAQSTIAVGSGGFWGKGHGEGTQTQLSFLPENHTDFVFSVWAEEWGFIGSLVALLCFFILVSFMIRSALRATDRFTALLAFGAAAMIFWHVFVNIAMVIGVLPVVGITLPFWSYGGSSMLTKWVAVAIAAHGYRVSKTS